MPSVRRFSDHGPLLLIALALATASVPALASPPATVLRPTAAPAQTTLLIHGAQIVEIPAEGQVPEGRVGQVRFVEGARVEQRAVAPTSDAHMRVVHGTQVTSVPAEPVGGPKLRLIHGARVHDRPVDDQGCLRDARAGSCINPTPTTPAAE